MPWKESVVAFACVAVAAGCSQSAETDDRAAAAQIKQATPATLVNAPVYLCPMDKDIRSHAPGSCPRCGMKLVTSVPDPVEYHLEMAVTPTPAPNTPVQVRFEVFDPWKDNPVTKFNLVHEKLFHAFAVSRDLEFFTHGHPTWDGGAFEWDVAFPKPGMYRILADFYPEASAPQLLTKTVFVAGDEPPVRPLARDYDAKQGENVSVQVSTQPEHPVAGMPARVRITVSPDEGLQKYLGVWAHMLAASDDLIDLMHNHPSIADGSSEMQFNMLFPRARVYRLWVQLQRHGVVNTVHFDVPVAADAAPPVASNRSADVRVSHHAG